MHPRRCGTGRAWAPTCSGPDRILHCGQELQSVRGDNVASPHVTSHIWLFLGSFFVAFASWLFLYLRGFFKEVAMTGRRRMYVGTQTGVVVLAEDDGRWATERTTLDGR